MKISEHKITVLMTGPAESVKGGMSTVVEQYLSYKDWENIDLLYIPTYIEVATLKKVAFFVVQILKILFTCIIKKVDFIHMHVSERGSFWRKAILVHVGKRFGIKTILHHHGAEFLQFYENESLKNRKRIVKIIGVTDCNLVLSHHHYQMLKEKFPEGNFKVLYNAIDSADGNVYNSDADKILFVGRLGERKGVYDLIEAIEQLEDILPSEIKVCFCGDGEVEKVREFLQMKKLEHRIAYIGWSSKEQLRQLYSQTILFVLPSYHEGLPMALLEAMYAGIPCIATNVDGISEVVQSGKNGLLVEAGNVEQIKSSLLKLIQNRELCKTLGENACETIQIHFLLEHHIQDLKKLYLEMKDDF